MTITFSIKHKLLTIYINEKPHLHLRRDTVVGFQSWQYYGIYTIEITYESGAKIIAEYDDSLKWTQIIKCLSEHLMPLD